MLQLIIKICINKLLHINDDILFASGLLDLPVATVLIALLGGGGG